MRTVFLKPRFKGIPLHRLYDELVKNPPEGYKFLTSQVKEVNRYSTIAGHDRSPLFKKIVYHFGAIPYMAYQLRDRVPIPKETDLIYAAQHITSTKKPWVVDVEHAGTLSGYSDLSMVKGIILRKLHEDNCKKIIAWSDWSKRTITKSFKDKLVEDKTEIIRYTVSPKLKKSKRNGVPIRLLFLGTINPGTLMNFEYKGLYETVSAFLKLQEEFKDEIQLVIRSNIPDDVRKIILHNKNIILHENYLSTKEMEDLFLDSDIFPHIGYEVLNLSVLEAMSYGLPVVLNDLFNSGELIQNSKNGFLISPQEVKPFYTKDELPNERSYAFTKSMRDSRKYMTEELTKVLRILIDDKKMRDSIGKASAMTIEDGEFSIKRRNELLKKVFDEAIS